MLHVIQFRYSESHLYSHTRSQKLAILSEKRVKCIVNTRQRLAIHTSIASKNTGVQRVKTPVKTFLLFVNLPIRSSHYLENPNNASQFTGYVYL